MFDVKFVLLSMLTPIASIAGFGFIVLYVIARWRAHREPVVDPQLGLKFALHYFATLAFQLVLVGVTIVLYTMLRASDDGEGEGSGKGELYRLAFGFLVPAGVVLAAHLALLARTNDRNQPGVRRLFVGFNLLVTGILGFGALVAASQALLMKGSSGGLGHLGAAAVVVYCSMWAVLAWRLRSLVESGDAMPDNIVPPAASLPPLGGGYPPR